MFWKSTYYEKVAVSKKWLPWKYSCFEEVYFEKAATLKNEVSQRSSWCFAQKRRYLWNNGWMAVTTLLKKKGSTPEIITVLLKWVQYPSKAGWLKMLTSENTKYHWKNRWLQVFSNQIIIVPLTKNMRTTFLEIKMPLLKESL